MNTINVIDDINALIEIKASQAAVSSAKQTDECGSWVIEDNTLINKRSDYFRISLYQTAEDEKRYLIKQNHGALVALITAEHDGRRIALLSVRFEPGLIDKINFTSSIQSTPSNYRREHGGKSTPFIDIVQTPEKFGDILYDGEQYDWGEYYLLKKKRYLIVRLKNELPVPEGFVWVTFELLHKMLTMDNFITNDLRVALFLLLHANANPISLQAYPELTSTFEKLPLNLGTADSQGVRLKFFEAQTPNREVSAWIQPLLVPAEKMEIKLSFSTEGAKKVFAVQQRTQVGLSGKKLWFPAYIDGSIRHEHVTTCAEGGRFWQHAIDIEIGQSNARHFTQTHCDSVVWKTEKELSEIIASPLTTSLELRMAASLIVRNTRHD